MKRWISLPLKDVLLIRERHNMVEYISQEEDFRDFIGGQIKQVGDQHFVIRYPLDRGVGEDNIKPLVRLPGCDVRL